jgi:hypothetical protein
MGDSAAVTDKIAAVFNPRWSSHRVAGYVEALYAIANSTVGELAHYAKVSGSNPYSAKIDNNSQITCGHHPWLEARVVDDLEVVRDPATGLETISWNEPPLYKLPDSGPGGPVIVRGPIPEKCVRRITGPVSNELVWDDHDRAA